MAVLRPLPNPPSLPLAERIAALRLELDAWLNARVEIERIANPGIPAGAILNLMTRGSGCQCAVFQELTAKESGA